MNTRFAVPLLCAAAIAFACGPRVHSAALARTMAGPQTASVGKTAPRKRMVKVPVLASALDVRVGPEVQFALRVSNASDTPLEVNFANGKTHDFAVQDSAGRVLWRWSTERMFTQSLQNRTIEARDTTVFDGSWTPPAGYHGKLVAVATLASSDHPIETRAEFTLP